MSADHGFADHFGALDRHGDRPALLSAHDAISYVELQRRIDAASAGRGPDRELVFLEARNDVASIVEYLSSLQRGDPVFLFGGDQPGLDALIARYRPDRVIGEGRTERLPARVRRPLAPSLAVLLSTSGTTGSPKLVKLSRRSLASNALAIAEYLGLAGDDRAMTSLKFNYSFGMSVLNSHVAMGAALILTEDSVVSPDFWALAERHGATSLSGVPYSFEMLAKRGESWATLPSLRHVAQAGGRLSPDLVTHFASLGERHGWRFFVMYGQTEAGPRMAYLPPELARTRAGHIGRPIPGGAFALLGPDGAEVQGEGEGELIFRGPGVMMGYAQEVEDLAEDSQHEQLATGDIARRDADGLYRIVGRAARFVKPFGLRINLDEVEADARTVAPDAVATGDDTRILVASAEADAATRAALRDRLAQRYQLPPHALAVLGLTAIPRLPSGKTDYKAVFALSGADTAPTTEGGADAPPSALSILLSPGFYRQAWYEALAILGLGGRAWQSVAEIFAMFVPGASPHQDRSFRDLGGDSLGYIQAALALEEYLGHLPPDWEGMTIHELERTRLGEGVL